MIINPDILRKELVTSLTAIEDQMVEVRQAAKQKGVTPQALRDSQGNWVMIPLLAAKVNAISALAQLQYGSKKESR